MVGMKTAFLECPKCTAILNDKSLESPNPPVFIITQEDYNRVHGSMLLNIIVNISVN